MIMRAPMTISKSRKMTKQQIEENFGEKLSSLGFVSKNNGTEWYGILKGKFFCSMIFQETFRNDILYRVQPLCCRLLHNLKKNDFGTPDAGNSCERASWIWRRNNQELYEYLDNKYVNVSDDVFVEEKLEFLLELFESVVYPYFLSVNDFSDIVCERDWWIPTASAYLSANADAYYNSRGLIAGFTDLNKSVEDILEYEFKSCIRRAGETKDMALVGKCLQRIELSNIEYLKTKLPKLFKLNPDFRPTITDEFITNCALTEVRTTGEFPFKIPDEMKIEGVDFLPFPMTAPNPIIDDEAAKHIAQNIIKTHFESVLCEQGFVSSNDGFVWHKLIDGIMYYYIKFQLNNGELFVRYDVFTIFDELPLSSQLPNYRCASMELLKIVGSPIQHEYFKNALNSGDDVVDWIISRLKCQLYYVVFPYFDRIKTLDDLAVEKGEYSSVAPKICKRASVYLDDTEISSEVISKYKKIKLSSKLNAWLLQWGRAMQSMDDDYIRYFLREAKRYNINLIRQVTPEFQVE